MLFRSAQPIDEVAPFVAALELPAPLDEATELLLGEIRLPAVQPDQLFELTLEPRSGSPTGRPTGPVRYIGRAVKVM